MAGKTVCAALALLLTLSPPAGAANAPSAEFAADVKLLVEKTKAFAVSDEITDQFVGPMLRSIKAANPAIPNSFLVIFREEMEAEIKANRDLILAEITKIYARHFSHDDIKQLIAFYETDLGRKTIGAMPVVARETAQAMQTLGQAMGTKAAERATQRFRAENEADKKGAK